MSYPMMCGSCGHRKFTVMYEGDPHHPNRLFITCAKCCSTSIINHQSSMNIVWGDGEGVLCPDPAKQAIGAAVREIEREKGQKLLDKK